MTTILIRRIIHFHLRLKVHKISSVYVTLFGTYRLLTINVEELKIC